MTDRIGRIRSYQYVFDAANRVTQQTIDGVVTKYGYDDANQLTSAGAATFTYDAAGNRTMPGYSTDKGNRIHSDGQWTYGYDDEGNVTSKSSSAGTWNYGYDHKNALTSAKYFDNTTQTQTTDATYTFDALGNRLSQTTTISGSTSSTRSSVDGWDTTKPNAWGSEKFDVTMDLDANNNVVVRRMFGVSFDNVVANVAPNGQVNWYLTDFLHSVRGAFDNGGQPTAAASFDAVGHVTNGTFVDRYGFSGREQDAGTGLRYNRMRVTDTTTWFSQDPLGFRAGDPNLYRVIGNQPTNHQDPSGGWWPASVVVGAVAGAVIGGGIRVIGNVINSRPVTDGVAGAVVNGAITGAIIGAVGPVGVATGIGVGVGAGAAGGAAGSIVDQLDRSGTVSASKVAKDAAVGAVAGAAGVGVAGAAVRGLAPAAGAGARSIGATIAVGATAGAAGGAVGGGLAGAVSAALNGDNTQDILKAAVEGAEQGALTGGIAGGGLSRFPSQRGPVAPHIPNGSVGGKGAGKPITPEMRERYFPKGEARPPCGYCRCNPSDQLDHVIPKSKNGDLTPDNIVPSCPRCNQSKGDREAPKTPPPNYRGSWPPSWWPQWMIDAWNARYGG